MLVKLTILNSCLRMKVIITYFLLEKFMEQINSLNNRAVGKIK